MRAEPTELRVPGSILIERLGEFNTLGIFFTNDGAAWGEGDVPAAWPRRELFVGAGGPGTGLGLVLNKDLLLLYTLIVLFCCLLNLLRKVVLPVASKAVPPDGRPVGFSPTFDATELSTLKLSF